MINRRQKSSVRAEGIVVGGAKKRRVVSMPKKLHPRRPSRRSAAIGIGVLCVVFVLGLVGILYDQKNNVSVYDIPDMGVEEITPPADDELPIVEPAAEIVDIEKQIAGYPAQGFSSRQEIELANLYSALGAAHTNAGQGEKAIAAYQTASRYATVEQERAIIGGKAYAYASIGQNDKAIKEFEILISYIEEHPDASSQRDVAGYRTEILKLQQGVPL